MTNDDLSEMDLHAFVDDRLPAERQAAVEALLREQPEAAERVRAHREHKAALRQMFASVLEEPIPDALRLMAQAENRRPAAASRWSHWSLQRVAASVFVLVGVGVASGWMARDRLGQDESVGRPLSRQAAVAHVVYSPDLRRPVEISAEHEDQLVTWLSKRLGTPVRPPKLGALGFELIGGRLLPGNSGPVAQFMYQDGGGQRLTLYVSNEHATNPDTAFRFVREGSLNVFYWVDGKFGYALSAPIPKEDLARVATVVYDQLNPR